MKTCPKCGVLNDYDWPLNEGEGGCQDCWEADLNIECYNEPFKSELRKEIK